MTDQDRVCTARRVRDGEPCALQAHDAPGDPVGHLTRMRELFMPTMGHLWRNKLVVPLDPLRDAPEVLKGG